MRASLFHYTTSIDVGMDLITSDIKLHDNKLMYLCTQG